MLRVVALTGCSPCRSYLSAIQKGNRRLMLVRSILYFFYDLFIIAIERYFTITDIIARYLRHFEHSHSQIRS